MANRRDRFVSGTTEVVVDLDAGARLASLAVGGHELLVTEGPSPIDWGSYPMAPWAGRVARGRFRFDGVEHRLAPSLDGHAIHGTVFDRPWERAGDGDYVIDLGPGWPFAGRARQTVSLHEDRLELRLEVQAAERMPASCGWHPWFRKTVAGVAVRLDFRPGFMLVRHGAIAGRERVAPTDPPWDDCFGDVAAPPTITWPGVATISIESSCRYFVVYDERDHALCVEPQTHPPNALGRDAAVLEPGESLMATTTWRFGDMAG